ncbi:MAG: hypothetical protein RI894_510, partial [Bacteroidota bacterium]
MKKTKIWAILQAIPPKEHKALIAFVTNRVALKQANICDLLHLLLRYIAAEKDISRAETYTQIWQNTTYNDVVLRLACSDLVEKVEDFLVLQAVDMEKGERERKLSFYFLKNAEGELANQYHNKLSQEKQENTVQGTDYFYADLIDCERYFEIQELLDLRNFDVEGIDKNLDKAFTVLKLKNTARKYAAYFVNNSPFDTASIDFILKYMEENPFLHQDKLIILYRDLFFLFVKGENSLLENIKKQLTDINLRLDEISFIHILIENHIAVTWQKGAFSRQDLFDWQLFGYEKGWIYMVGGFINTVRLQNILTNYITFQKYTEALAFLNAHKTRISIGEREETYNLNIGH